MAGTIRDMVKLLRPSSPAEGGTPTAVRAARPGWRDPRLWIGVVVVLVCVLAGGRMMASADDSVEVWSLNADQAPGAVLTPEDLSPRRVHFADPDQLREYYLTSDDLPDRLTLLRSVGKDELLPRGAVGQPDASGLVQLPLAVDPDQVPPSVRVGSLVDVYVIVPTAISPLGKPAAGQVRPAIAGARVVAMDADTDGVGSPDGAVQLTVSLPQREVDDFFTRLAAADSPLIVVVGR